MNSYAIAMPLNKPYDEAVAAVRSALEEQGFGILTEIDLKATMKAKLDVDIEPHLILGACRPSLAYEAIRTEPSIAVVLPCNVVVRGTGRDACMVEAFDPDAMMGMSDNEALHAVATDARQRITAALASLTEEK